MSAVSFSAGVVLTTATQLRVGGTPFGPGEALLVGWIGVSVALLCWDARLSHTAAANGVLLFWACAVPTLVAGTLWGYGVGVSPAPGFEHDLAAFAFVALLFLLFVLQPRLEERVRMTAPLAAGFTVIPLFFVLVSGVSGPVHPWFGPRFTGWAVNPNQLALGVVVLPFYGLHMVERSDRRLPRVFFAAIVLGSLVLGAASLSDALFAAWAVGLGLAGAYFGARVVARPTSSFLEAALRRLALPLATLGALGVAWHLLIANLVGTAMSVYSAGGQGSARLLLWSGALDAMMSSPLFGLGPGAHAGYGVPFQGSEAHNTLMDWGASTGLLGLAIYLGYLGWLARRALQAGAFYLAAGVITLFVFGSFHYVLRHPTFWFYTVVIANLCTVRPPIPRSGAEAAPGAGGGDGAGVAN